MMCTRLRSPLVPFSLFIIALVVALPALAEATAPPEQQSSGAEGATAVAARCQRCGDGYCARSCENEFTCPADCAPQTEVAAARCGKCGDGQCVRQCGETPESCPADCGYSSESATSDKGTAVKCERDKPAEAAPPQSKKD